MKVSFMGTPDFAVAVWEGLIGSEEHEVVAVVTQPDKARGRSGKLVFTPVKEVAVRADIPVYTPKRVRDDEFIQTLQQIVCDVIVVVAFGQILPKEVLEYPKYGCINVHASLLPRWRGAAPMQWAILEGDETTGITTMQMNEGLDTGDMLMKVEVPIAADETGESLHDKMAALGSDLLLATLKNAEAGALQPVAQNDDESTYACMLKKEMGNIEWTRDAISIERQIRGLNSWPSAYSKYNGKMLKIWRANVVDKISDQLPGTIIEVKKNSFVVQTGVGSLEILETQLEGKKRMDAGSFMRGVQLKEGECLCHMD